MKKMNRHHNKYPGRDYSHENWCYLVNDLQWIINQIVESEN